MGRTPEKTFSKEDIQMENRHMEECSASLIIREMKIRITRKCHLTLVRMATIQNTTHSKCQQKCREKGIFMYFWQKYKLVQSLLKIICMFLGKLKIELPCNPAISNLNIYSKETKTLIQKDISTPVNIAALLAIAKIWKPPKCTLIDEWTCMMEHHRVIKKNGILPL